MAKITGGKRITTEDFPADNQELVEKLAFILNPFLSEVISAFEGKIDISNLNMSFQTVKIKTDSTGKVTNTARFKIANSITGMIVINARTTINVNLVSAPFCTYRTINSVTEIQHVTGLPPNTEYTLKLLLFST